MSSMYVSVRPGDEQLFLPGHPSLHQVISIGNIEMHDVEPSFFEVLTDRLGCLRWICRQVVQPFLVHETTKLRQRILYNTEVFVLRIDVSLRVKTEVGRTHIGSHIRYAQLLYLWTCIASGSGCKIIVELVVMTMFCFRGRWLECGVCRNCSLLHGVRTR